ncbi:WD40 repeat domain-containing protein [Sulfuricurvum sp.]|nr:WD40 repeat domain-containing protein [Sulfuricurvum sp.]AFV97049.1 hypothetical protein B649_03675 [Candidatus Sulfuricurvum sp. RIFRC-1]
MPTKTDLTQFESPIVLIQPLQYPLIGVVTANHEICLFNTQTKTNKKILRLNIPENAQLLCAFDPNHMNLLFGNTRSERLNIIDLQEKKIIHRFELDQQTPTALMFANDGLHFICGTDQGRVLLWRFDSPALISRLHSYPEYTSLYVKPKINFVSAFAFDGNRLATSGYGGSVVLTHYRSQTRTKRYHPSYVENSALLFYKDNLIIGNRSGTILKIDSKGKHPNQRLSTSINTISQLLKIGQESYILAVGDKPYATLINANTMQIIYERYIDVDQPITALCKDESDNLYVGTATGELFQFDLLPFNQLEKLIESKSYAQAYLYCEQEPLLKESNTYNLLESLFQRSLQHAKALLEKGETEQAKIHLQPFMPTKSKEIGAILAAFSQMKQLSYLFKHQKFSPFYGLVEQFPLLNSTMLYAKVEEQWGERFKKAQKLMFVDKRQEAQAELAPFATVNAKRPYILLLIQHTDIFRMYSKAVYERNYTQLNHLIIRYPLLRKLPSYNDLIKEAGELIAAITEALKEQTFEYVQVLMSEFSLIPQYEKEFLNIKTFVSHALNLHHAITHSHWRSAYSLIDTHSELMILPWAQELEILWLEKLERCEKYASIGDASAIKKEFINLINLPGRHERIGDLLRSSYHVQLKKLLDSNPDIFSVGVANYCDLFGIDTEIRHLLRIAKHKHITPKIEQALLCPKQRDQWIYHITELRGKIA